MRKGQAQPTRMVTRNGKSPSVTLPTSCPLRPGDIVTVKNIANGVKVEKVKP
jgi:hypothetical protein